MLTNGLACAVEEAPLEWSAGAAFALLHGVFVPCFLCLLYLLFWKASPSLVRFFACSITCFLMQLNNNHKEVKVKSRAIQGLDASPTYLCAWMPLFFQAYID